MQSLHADIKNSKYECLKSVWKQWNKVMITEEQNQTKIQCEEWLQSKLNEMYFDFKTTTKSKGKKQKQSEVSDVLVVVGMALDLLVYGNESVREEWRVSVCNKNFISKYYCQMWNSITKTNIWDILKSEYQGGKQSKWRCKVTPESCTKPFSHQSNWQQHISNTHGLT